MYCMTQHRLENPSEGKTISKEMVVNELINKLIICVKKNDHSNLISPKDDYC